MEIPLNYIRKIKNRTTLSYYKGLSVRLLIYCKYAIIRRLARIRGAQIGDNSIIPLKLAMKANKNLHIGKNTICESSCLDLRSPIIIEDNCIINKQVQIIRVSHCIDDNREFTTRYYKPLIIKSYSWLCTGCHILPSVNTISKGSVVSAFATLVMNTEEMDVIGLDGKVLRKHNALFDNLVIVSLKGGDYKFYLHARKYKA